MCKASRITPDEENLVHALVHDARVRLTGDNPSDFNREAQLDAVKRLLQVAEAMLAGNASEEQKSSARDLVHGDVRTTFGL